MPWDDFYQLVAFNSVSPISDERADVMSAQNTQVLANLIQGALGGKGSGLTLQQLMPFGRNPDSEAMTPASGEAEDIAVDHLLGIVERGASRRCG